MNRMKNARFDSERDADKNPTFENGWGRKDRWPVIHFKPGRIELR